MLCFFVSDLHGNINKYEKLFSLILKERPDAVFIGGDILPSGMASSLKSFNIEHRDFVNDFLAREFKKIKKELDKNYPEIFIILGNDDGRFSESSILDCATYGIWKYIHNRKVDFKDFYVYGYSYIPPTPFQLKDWEKYDVSRYVDPACIGPEEGFNSIPRSSYELKYSTIQKDLNLLAGEDNLEKAIFLFHSPPYKTSLDRAALDNLIIDGVHVDVHIGSIAIKNFIEKRQPLITLHGHVHESTGLTGQWFDKIGKTLSFNGAYDGSELSVIKFNPHSPEEAFRELI